MADKALMAKIHFCPLWSKSGQARAQLECRLSPLTDMVRFIRSPRRGASRSLGGMVRLRALAVLRLITSSILVGNSTGRSPGLAPFKILST